MSKKRKRNVEGDTKEASNNNSSNNAKGKDRVKSNPKQQKRQSSTSTSSASSILPAATDDHQQQTSQHPTGPQSDLLDHAGLMESMADVEFSAFTAVGARSSNQPADFGKPGSKMRRLKRMLDEADAKRRRLEVLNQNGDVGKQLALGEQWSDALKDVSGAKSITDTTKLRKAIKKREKSKEKSSREWAVSYIYFCTYCL